MLDFSNIDWPKAISYCGVDEKFLKKRAGPCPICDGKDRFRFDNKHGMGNWFCQQCGAGTGFSLIQKATNKSAATIMRELEEFDPSAVKEDDAIGRPIKLVDEELTEEEIERNRPLLNWAWDTSRYRNGSDPASKYLRKRVPRVDLGVLSSDIRVHPGMRFCEYSDDNKLVNRGRFWVMLSRVVDGKGTPINLHRTYLTADGAKAPFEKVKKLMGGVRKLRGAAVRLNDVPQSRVLGITEGIETGVAVLTGYRNKLPVWSLINAHNLSIADIPREQFDRVIIFSDHDRVVKTKKVFTCECCKDGHRPGIHYAKLAKAKLESEGFEVEIKTPKEEGDDFADVWFKICETA